MSGPAMSVERGQAMQEHAPGRRIHTAMRHAAGTDPESRS
jgi:hypothetical protein